MLGRYSRGTGSLNDALDRIRFDDDPVLAQLFLDEDDLFRAFDDKVTAGIEGTFSHAGKLRVGMSSQDALVTTEHDGQAANVHVGSPHDILSAGVLNRDEDRRAVGDIA